MDTRRAQARPPPSQHPLVPLSVLSPSALKDELKARLGDILRQRDQATSDMSDRLYAMIVAYKEADQALVDQHAACLAQVISLFPDAADTCTWAKPCIGVPEREWFAQRGIAFTFHPVTDRYGFGQQGPVPDQHDDTSSPSPNLPPRRPPSRHPKTTLPSRSPSPFPTPSIPPSSPEHTLASEHNISKEEKKAHPDEPTRPNKRHISSPSTADELAPEQPTPFRPKPKRHRGPPQMSGSSSEAGDLETPEDEGASLQDSQNEGNSLAAPFEYIKLSTESDRANDEVHRLERHLSGIGELINKFDSAIKTLSAKVEERWPTRHTPYLAVSVLLIQWEEDDLGVVKEILELRDLLTRFFRYKVEVWSIPRGTHRSIYKAIFNKLDEFTQNGNNDMTLLWIYYAGHAMQSPKHAGPLWFPTRRISSETYVDSSPLLNLVLGELDCDVLLLFDCCQAIPPQIRSTGAGVVSVLSATGFDIGATGTAAEVGPHSFTRALIDELGTIFNSFVDGTNQAPVSDITLHGSLLARLKVHLSSLEKNRDGSLRINPLGGVAFEPPRRRTPIYRFLSESKNPRPIYIAPFPKDSRGKYETAALSTSQPAVRQKDVPRVLIRVLLNENSFSIDKFANWVLQAPPEAIQVEIEAAYGSLSTLLIVKMPLATWELVPPDPAMSLIGYVTSSNKADTINQQVQRKIGQAKSVSHSTNKDVTATMASQIPTHHRAIAYDAPGRISTALLTVPTPTPGPGQLLLRLTHSGVCSSDHGVMTNQWTHLPPTPTNQIGGHEGVGHIVSVGPNTTLPANLSVGSRVGVKWIASICGTCMACLSGRDAMCPDAKVSGFFTPGTFQQYVLADAAYVTPIPEGVESGMAAPLLCGGVTVYAGLRKCGAKPGDSVVVSGAGGGLGHLAVQIAAKGMGLRVIGIDSGEKEEFVRSLGAEAFFDVTKYSRDQKGSEQLAEDVKKATPRGMGATSVIVCAGANAAYAQALSLLSFGGTLVCVGFPEGAEPVPIAGAFPGNLIARELSIVGSAVGSRKEAIETMDMAARGVIKTHYTLEPMSKLTDVFEKMERMELQGRVVIDMSRE
ncbi:hypothetical protein OQA88_13333 [Cercophora sp. LCS_1]